MFLASCPTDILVQIFLRGDVDQIKTWSEVCRRFATIIASDVEVQYNIELMQSCMVDQPKSHSNMSIVERHQALRAFIAARHNLWTSSREDLGQFEIAKIDVSEWLNDRGALWEYSCGMVVVEKNGFGSCTDVLPGKTLGSATTTHYADSHQPPLGPTFDGNKVLFAWVSPAFDVGPGEVDIHLMSPITGESHPEAKASPIYENLPRANSYDIELYHHFVSVKSRTQPETEMCVYDWRSGTRKLKISFTRSSLICQTFLDEGHIIICTSNKEKETISITIYSIEICTVRFVLQLHPARESAATNLFGIFSNGYTNSNRTRPSLPFHTSCASSIIALSLGNIEASNDWHMICVIPYSFLKAKIDRHRSSGATEIVPWGEWPNCIFRPQSGWPRISAYGHHLAIGYRHLNITIHDFSPSFFKKPRSLVPKYLTTNGNHPWRDSQPETDMILTHRPPATTFGFTPDAVVTKAILEDDILGVVMGRWFRIFKVPLITPHLLDPESVQNEQSSQQLDDEMQ